MEQNQNIVTRGLRGLFSGLRTGVLMMGIFALVSATLISSGALAGLLSIVGLSTMAAAVPATGFVAALGTVLPGAIIGALSTGLFGAVNSMTSTPARETVQIRGHDGVMRSAHITQAPTVAMPIISGHAAQQEHTHEVHHETAPQQQASWASRVGHNHKDRIADIIANGSMSDQDRAAALLAERAEPSAEHGRA